MIVNDAGIRMEKEWLELKIRYSNIDLHEYQVMPNHFHGIIEIFEPCLNKQMQRFDENGQLNETATTIGDMMAAFKSITTVEYIRDVKHSNWPRFNGKLWQRNYYEHLFRNEKSYQNIANYIINNPKSWNEDKFSAPEKTL